MSIQAPQDNLYWNLLQVGMRAKHSLIRLAETYDLSIMQLYTLCSMEAGKPVPMNFISTLLSCDASNITGIADRLITSGLIERKENPNDRRVKVISLTPKGEDLKQELLLRIQDHESSTLDNLSAAQKQELQNIVSLALQNPKS